MKLLLLMPLFAICALSALAQIPKIEPGVSKELAVWRAAHYSHVRYNLSLTLEKMSPVLNGTIEIHVTVTKPRSGPPEMAGGSNVPPIILDWRTTPGHENVSKISSLYVNGVDQTRPPPYVVEELRKPDERPDLSGWSGHLVIKQLVHYGENVIKIDFRSPILASGSAITRYIDKEDGSEYVYALLGPGDASTAFPVFDQPDLKARFSLSVEVSDPTWKVISNSPGSMEILMVNPSNRFPGSASNRRFFIDFAETKPISTYGFSFAAGPWYGQRCMFPDCIAPLPEIKFYFRQSQAKKFPKQNIEMFQQLSNRVDKLIDKTVALPEYDFVLIPATTSDRIRTLDDEYIREAGIIFMPESSVFK